MLPLARLARIASHASIPQRMARPIASFCSQTRFAERLVPAFAGSLMFPRFLHATPAACAKVPFLLADIGEGITECEVIQWWAIPKWGLAASTTRDPKKNSLNGQVCQGRRHD
ncbi:hypothetical protein BC830DRAFT_614053 [Chytriomyces sp. MP71]|nr:hypothetical protein BC830DRAFT_614053 [Chytriomyces sp. MP71]